MKCCGNYIYNPSYAYASRGGCGAISLDSGREWGIAKNMTFKTMDYAKFYMKNGVRAESDFNEKD